MNNNTLKYVREVNHALGKINGLWQKWDFKSEQNRSIIQVLYALYFNEIDNQKQICSEFELPKQTVSRVIKQLEDNGYIRQDMVEGDKRSRRIVLTKEGRLYAEKQLEHSFLLEDSILDEIGVRDYETLIQMMNRYAEAIEKSIQKLEDNQ